LLSRNHEDILLSEKDPVNHIVNRAHPQVDLNDKTITHGLACSVSFRQKDATLYERSRIAIFYNKLKFS